MVIERYRSVLRARGGQGAEISLFVERRCRRSVVFRFLVDRSAPRRGRFRGRSSQIEARMGRGPDGHSSREILFD
jgi:hypothetical protein